MKIRTRFILIVITATIMVYSGMKVLPQKKSEGIMNGKALFNDVLKYAKLSPHRTGSKADIATARWIADELKKAGLDNKLQAWKLRQFFINRCRLTIKGKDIEAFPFWYPRATGARPVKAHLTLMKKDTDLEKLKGKIAFIPSSDSGRLIYFRGVNSMAEKAAKAGATGLIVAVGSFSGDLTAINGRKPYHQKPLPLPCIMISIKDEAIVAKSAESGEISSILIKGKDNHKAPVYNVIGTLKRGRKWVVVTTPISGWFECAGERGPGVALFLALARWAGQGSSQFSYMFMANSGHELDNIGAHHTLDKYAPGVKEVACWIHLGASISTRNWERKEKGLKPLSKVNSSLHLVCSEDLLPILKKAFINTPGYRPRSRGFIAGELRHFIKAGYRAFGFFGGHAFFHTRFDKPETTGPELLEPVGRALVQVIRIIEAEQKQE